MKLSLRWIFDHLKADFKKHSVETLVAALCSKTAEVEGYRVVDWNLKDFSIVQVTAVDKEQITALCFELKQIIKLSARTDAKIGASYFIKKNGNHYAWAQLADFGSSKEGLFPEITCSEKERAGKWKQLIEKDYILEIDNKSITNRPDLWGHRGFARELAVLFDLKLKDEKEFLAPLAIQQAPKTCKATKDLSYCVKITASKACKNIAVLPLTIDYVPACDIVMALRLVSIDLKPINYIVDATNYVMLDFGHPMHAFDAQNFPDRCIEVAMADKDEKLTVLDGSQLQLTEKDLVISNGKKPLGLAGIMGGLATGVNAQTKDLLIEAAAFDATTIRLSAATHKLRTEASARFEKTLDLQGPLKAIKRFVQLLKDKKNIKQSAKKIVVVGDCGTPLKIKLTHTFIESKIGMSFSSAFIKKVFVNLGFTVTQKGDLYTVTVPTFRSSKDITIPEDLVEEVARIAGYDTIKDALPSFVTTPADLHKTMRLRTIKQQLAFGACLQEVENYSLFDNDFLKQISWDVEDAVMLANPLSQQQTVLVTSLIPHLLKNVEHNRANHDQLGFFEVAACWSLNKDTINERKILAGIFFDKKESDFYAAKQQLSQLFHLLKISVAWKKATTVAQWAHQYQVADLFYDQQKIGSAGLVKERLMHHIGGGQAFVFELDADFLVNFKPQEKTFVPLSKYQPTALDVSVLVPTMVTVEQLTQTLYQVDSKIYQVTLVDEFKKAEWENKKSITLRFWIKDTHKTLTKEEIDATYQAAQNALAQQGAHVR